GGDAVRRAVICQRPDSPTGGDTDRALECYCPKSSAVCLEALAGDQITSRGLRRWRRRNARPLARASRKTREGGGIASPRARDAAITLSICGRPNTGLRARPGAGKPPSADRRDNPRIGGGAVVLQSAAQQPLDCAKGSAAVQG